MTTWYTVYRTVNRINGKFYIGAHKTSNLQDGYLGSGVILKRAVAKYGAANFAVELLQSLPGEEEMWDAEELLIEKNISNPLCMNLRQSSRGGFDYINRSGLNGCNSKTVEGLRKSDITLAQRRKDDLKLDERLRAASALSFREYHKRPEAAVQTKTASAIGTRLWTGRKHSEQSCRQMSEAHMGDKNHFTGRKWMTHPELGNKPVKKEEIEAHQKDGWVFGRRCSTER